MSPSLLDLIPAREGHFKLESGYHGSLWMDLEPLFVQTERLKPAVVELAGALSKHNVEAVCGPLLGGAFLAQLLAETLGVAFYYTERFVPAEAQGLFAVQYHLPKSLRPTIAGKTVAIVDDAISAGSSVRATLSELNTCGARTVAIGALFVLGTTGLDYFTGLGLPVEALERLPYTAWRPEECPLCAEGWAVETPNP